MTLFRRYALYSKWRIADALLSVWVFFAGSWLAITYPVYQPLWWCAVPGLLFTFFGKTLYEKDVYSFAFRLTTGIIRAVIYIVVIGALMLPSVLARHSDWKWAYPIRRALFLSTYSEGSIVETLLPEQLPAQADQYSAQFIPKVLQGDAGVMICYYTDSTTIADYCAYAEYHGAAHYRDDPKRDKEKEQLERERLQQYGKSWEKEHPELAKTDRWLHYMETAGATADDLDGADIYIFGEGYSNAAVWMLNRQTGYFRIYW